MKTKRLVLWAAVFTGVMGFQLGREFAPNYTPDTEAQEGIALVAGITAALIPIGGAFAWDRARHRSRVKFIANFVKAATKDDRERVEAKISMMIHNLDRVRSYNRHLFGVGDLFGVRRSIQPSKQALRMIDDLEQECIRYIAASQNEVAVDKALDKVAETVDSVIRALDEA
jgi:hypothetical protein